MEACLLWDRVEGAGEPAVGVPVLLRLLISRGALDIVIQAKL